MWLLSASEKEFQFEFSLCIFYIATLQAEGAEDGKVLKLARQMATTEGEIFPEIKGSVGVLSYILRDNLLFFVECSVLLYSIDPGNIYKLIKIYQRYPSSILIKFRN